MNDRPDAAELISIARHTLLSEVLPDARHEHLYALRMIANALGIAARELEAQDADVAAETQGLNALYGDAGCTGNLQLRNRQLARDIRRGAFERSTSQEAELRRHLTMTARAKLAAAYPKGLARPAK